ncbi:CRISPR-associated helicase/endonuclease Cas3 [Reinekea marinisedimentorum]|uniref:CRISPR-associated endonuclease/helicase Cas3 n=1 Tax=Reinekea marinisedimentorum TaxID=230495 RepID=A0A4R3I0G5_9GAMM|nr:CRISPR-associated helicase/endonuclease Cas3 [Reinekea marinisedimentorum]TCS39018.1 CRISPR-associated endonuclease/helicase Cas3 [Reinekea marinisedimentorum]
MSGAESTIPAYMKYWGKAKKEPDGEGADYHLLPYHCLDVAAVADVWLKASPSLLKKITGQLGVETEIARQFMLFFILLHDLGKFDTRFQHFRADIHQSLQGGDWWFEEDPSYYSHGSCGYKQFCEEFEPNAAMKAVAGHHGFVDVSFDYYEPEADDELIELDVQARKEWVQFCLDFCQLDEIPKIGEVPLLAGLCSVSDWIGSSITNFTIDQSLDLTDYYQRALPRAAEALKDSGMIESIQGSGFGFLFPEYHPRGIQCLLADLPLDAGLTIVEADTGAGKTEFALAYASSLIQAGLADGIVFGLPTQATANGLFDRIGSAANILFPDAQATLAHGKSHYLVADESGFLHQSKKRAFLGSVSVATIDQILMGVLGIKHQFVRSFGTRKSVLILDEIHSFDPYMMALIEQVLKGQHEAYSSVILLSATLPNQIKQQLLGCYQGVSESQDYPLVSHTDLSGKTNEYSLSGLNSPNTKKTVNTELWRSNDCLPDSEQLQEIYNWVQQGAMVGVICNTVADAQRLYRQVSLSCVEFPVDLFHARYTAADRVRIENQVLTNYGKNATRQGRLLISTQVVEQSLDLDFDILISQIAPIEYLMQRMGRLWRHDRDGTELCPRSDAVDKPLFITLIPTAEIKPNQGPDSLKKHYGGSGFVYQSIRWLYRTEQYLYENSELAFPDCYRSAIKYVHGLEPHVGEPKALTQLSEAFELKGEGSHYTARQISAMQSKPLNDVDPRCALLTREGEMSVSVVLFNKKGGLWHGGNFAEQADRERSLISLAPKHAKGKKCAEYYCYIAVIGEDIQYNEMGFIREDLSEELKVGR